MSELQQLRDRVAELEHVIGITDAIPLSAKLRLQGVYKGDYALLGILLARPFVPRVAIYDAMYGMRAEGEQPDMKVIDVRMSHLRKGLRQHGIEIKTQFGEGYFMTEPNKKKVRELIAKLEVVEQ